MSEKMFFRLEDSSNYPFLGIQYFIKTRVYKLKFEGKKVRIYLFGLCFETFLVGEPSKVLVGQAALPLDGWVGY